MVTKQAVENSLKGERVQEPFAAETGVEPRSAAPVQTTLPEGLVLQLKGERVQQPTLAAGEAGATYHYTFTVNRPQPVVVEVPGAFVTFLGDGVPAAVGGAVGEEGGHG